MMVTGCYSGGEIHFTGKEVDKGLNFPFFFYAHIFKPHGTPGDGDGAVFFGFQTEIRNYAIGYLSNIEIKIPHQEIDLSLLGDGCPDIEIFEGESFKADIDNHANFLIGALIVNDDGTFIDAVSRGFSSVSSQRLIFLFTIPQMHPRISGTAESYTGNYAPHWRYANVGVPLAKCPN